MLPHGSLLVLSILISAGAAGQNLVPNPGFEEFFHCPGQWNYKAGLTKIAPGWNSPTGGTPDVFNSCGSELMGVPYNFAGVMPAHGGNGYAGMYVWHKGREYREYLQARFTEKLKPRVRYAVTFYFCLARYSRYSSGRIGVLLSDSLHADNDVVLPVSPTLSVHHDSAFHRASGTWERLDGIYEAHGGEQFITIGNFAGNADTPAFDFSLGETLEPMLSQSSYFYIDDVTVAEITTAAELPPEMPETGKTYVLRNIQFEYDRFVLLPSSFAELDKIVGLLNEHPDWKATFAGHTDDVGTTDYNQRLSEHRARACTDYVSSKGIARGRLKAMGKGKTEPLIRRTDDDGRAINRRVEVEFQKDDPR